MGDRPVMIRRYRHPLATLAAAVLASWLLAWGATSVTILANQYPRYGFLRSVVFLFQQQFLRLLLPVVVIVLLLAALAWLWRRRGRDALRLTATLLALAGGLSLFVRLAYIHNRFRHAELWNNSASWAGVRVPEAVVRWEVWRTNLLIVAAALLLFIVLRFLLLRLLRLRAATGAWRGLGSPLVAVLILALALLPLVGAGQLRRQIAERPHIILVSIDTLRGDRLGCYGYRRNTSPQMDALAAEGILFESVFSQAPNTPPSHMSIFTSLYPTVHGFYGSGDRLAGWRLTLAEYLREAGYRTYATTDGGFMRGWYGFGQGYECYDDHRKGIARSVDLVSSWLDNGLADSPLFLFIHCYDVHCPYNPPRPFRDEFTDPAYAGGFNPGCAQLEAIRGRLAQDPAQGHGLSPADIAQMEALYDAGILYTDAIIGRLVRDLAARGLLEKSWLILTSDHGEEFTEHGSVLHDKLYHTVTRVPLILRPPGPARPGRRVPEIVELIDLMPTILEIAGCAPVSEMQGRSLSGLLQDPELARPARAADTQITAGRQTPAWKNVAFSELPWAGRRRGITTPRLHVLTSLDGHELEAYDYRRDPLEQVSLADRAAEEEIGTAFERLIGWSAAQVAMAAGLPAGTESFAIDESARRELESLGYVQ